MKTISILLATVALFFISCGSGNGSQTKTADTTQQVARAYDNSLTKGKIIDSVICQNQNEQSYALYLPASYTPDKKFPCIYFFDAHARGTWPLKLYKNLADQYGFVLVGSNTSKNGTQWATTNDGVKTLMADTRARINIDPHRIYTCGFSGGSRVASSVAIMDGGVAGVIGCAAGFPNIEQAFQNKFDYFGMVGDYDFNLTDMEQLDAALEQNGFTHQLLTFTGKHDWPPLADFQTALLWIQANAIRENRQPQNDTLLTALKNDYDKRIATAAKAGDVIKEYNLLAGIVKALNGSPGASSYQKQLAGLAESPAFKNAVGAQAQLQQIELAQQQELAKQFTIQDGTWWTKKIAELNQNARSAKTPAVSQMYRRLLNFLGLVGYLNSSNAINNNYLPNAGVYLKIFKMADPQNPDCSYLTALYYMKKGNRQQAVAALKEAASLGYSDVLLLTTDPTFSNLQNDAAYKNVIIKVQQNAAK